MGSNLSEGPILIHDTEVASINIALAEIQERIDRLVGLRGRTSIYDRVRISAPVEDEDALRLDSLTGSEAVAHVTFLASGPSQVVAYQPGTTYVELGAPLRQRVNFASPASLEARVIVQGWGTQASSGKGVAITQSDGTVIAQVTWDGNAEALQIGTFSSVTLTEDTTVQVRVKGSSSTESLVLRGIILDLRYDAGDVVSL